MDTMEVIRDFNTLVMFSVLVGLGAFGITTIVCECCHWLRKKWKSRRSKGEIKPDENISE